jgi:hypothetical protein
MSGGLVNAGQLYASNAGATSSFQSSAFTVPANTLVIVDVTTYHTTPANLRTPTLSSLQGLTYDQVGSPVDDGRASPLIRTTRFRTMVDTDVDLEQVTADTAGVNQTQITMCVQWIGSVDCSGTRGDGAMGGSDSADSGGSDVTTLASPPDLGAYSSPNNGAAAVCITSGGAGITPRPYWSEVSEQSPVLGTRTETQFLDAGFDTVANCTAGSGKLAVRIDEIIAPPHPATLSVEQSGAVNAGTVTDGGTVVGGGGTTRWTVVFRRCRLLFLALESTSDETFSLAAVDERVTMTPLWASSRSGNTFYVWQITITGDRDVTSVCDFVASIDTNQTFSWQLFGITSVDATAGTLGVIQSGGHQFTPSTVEDISHSAYASANSFIVLFAGGNGVAPWSTGDWSNGWHLSAIKGSGNIAAVGAAFRNSAPEPMSMEATGISGSTAFFVELAAAEGAAEPTNRPVVTVESPLPYNDPDYPIDPTEWLVFTVTDEDAEPGLGGGLERALPIILFPDGTDALVHDGDTFRPRFAGSTREAISGGYRYTVRPSSGRWTQAPTLLPYAYDGTGLEAL